MDNPGRGNMIVKATPIIPSHNNCSTRPIRTVANGVHDGGHPGWATGSRHRAGVIGILACWHHPGHGWELTDRDVTKDLFGRHDDVTPNATRTGQFPILILRLAHVLDGIRSRPD